MNDEEREKAAVEGLAFLRLFGIILAVVAVRKGLEIWLPELASLFMPVLLGLVLLGFLGRRRFRLTRQEWIAVLVLAGVLLALALLPGP